MDPNTILWTSLLAVLPISELRGAIPFALARGADPLWAYLYAVVLNAAVAPACWLFLSTVNKLLLRWGAYRSFFERFVDRARDRVHAGVRKWGWLGIAAFVAVPLPITGAWTGTLGAWMLGMKKRSTFAAVALGVAISGAIVSAVVLLGVKALDFVVKRV